MPYCKPPIEHRFKSPNSIKSPGRPKGPSPLTELKHLLEKKISYEDPQTHKKIKGKIVHVIALRHILNACQGDHNAISDIFDRLDGKALQKIVGDKGDKIVVIIHNNRDGRKDSRASILSTPESADNKR